METLPLCLLLYSRFLLPFTLHRRVCVCLPACQSVCAHAQRKTSFRAAGIYYNPNKRGRRIVYELLAFQRQQRPVFS